MPIYRYSRTIPKDIQIQSSTKSVDNNLKIPTNPFEIMEKIRRANSMNDATVHPMLLMMH